MPDADGNFKGQGWTRRKDAAWARAFGGQPEKSSSRYKVRGTYPNEYPVCLGPICDNCVAAP